MFSSFSRPKGAAIDVKELEYISALHQSQTSPLRTNGTISSMDIQLFLKSRYGIDVTEEDALDILRGLGGTSASATTTATAATGAATVTRGRRSCCSSAAMDDQSKEEEEEEEEEYLDIAQLTSILLIPTLLKACHDIISIHNNNNNNNNNDIHETMKNTIQHANNQITSIQTKLSSSSSKTFCTYWKLQKDIVKWKHVIQEVQHVQEHTPNPRWIVRDVLRILLAPLHDDCGDDDDDDEYKLTIQSLQTLLITHGEEDMAKNIPLLQSMIDSCAAATLPGRKKDDEKEVVLHKVSFAKALSFDLQTWNIGCEDNQRTNTYHDVFLKDYYNDFEELDDIFFQKRNNDDENADGGGGGGGGYRFAKLYLNAIIMRGGMNKDARNVDDNGAGANQQCMMKERTSQDETHVESSSDVETAIIHEEEETEETSALFQDVPTTITNNEKEISFSCHDDDDDDDNLKTSTSSTTDDTINDLTTTTTTTTTKNPNHVKTAPYIDYVVDSYRSLTFLMSLWIFYLITLLLFSNIVGRVEREAYCDTPTFSCNLVRDLITWITIAILLSVGGLVIIVPISIANDSSKKSPYIVTFSFVLLALYTFIPYKYIMKYRTHIPHDAPGGGNSTELKRFIQSDFALVITTIFLAFGCIMLFMMAILFVITFVPYEFVANHHPTTWTFWDMLLPSHFTSTANVKLAGTHKVNELLQNAIQMHQLPPDDDTHEHDGSIDDDDDDDESAAAVVHDRRQPVNAIQNFVLNGEHEEQCGGFIWTWKRIFTKELTRKDGIWLHSRLAIGQMGQIISLGLYVTLLSWLAHSLAEDARNARARIIADWRLPDDWESWALNIVPTPSMIYSAFIPGAVIAFISGILLISVYGKIFLIRLYIVRVFLLHPYLRLCSRTRRLKCIPKMLAPFILFYFLS